MNDTKKIRKCGQRLYFDDCGQIQAKCCQVWGTEHSHNEDVYELIKLGKAVMLHKWQFTALYQFDVETVMHFNVTIFHEETATDAVKSAIKSFLKQRSLDGQTESDFIHYSITKIS